jgi:hypothetical protein
MQLDSIIGVEVSRPASGLRQCLILIDHHYDPIMKGVHSVTVQVLKKYNSLTQPLDPNDTGDLLNGRLYY